MQHVATTASGLPLFRLSVARYHAMRDAGILDADDRVELLAGMIVPKMTKNPPHRLATRLARAAVEAVAPRGFYVDSQEPVTTADSEPEPDVVLVRGEPRDYGDRHPGPSDVVLLVEIADDSLPRDRGEKLEIYANAGIATYWIVNLRARAIEVYTEPLDGAYARRVDHDAASEVAVVVDGREVGRIRVDAILP
jgi:Uma2 family endonuclease